MNYNREQIIEQLESDCKKTWARFNAYKEQCGVDDFRTIAERHLWAYLDDLLNAIIGAQAITEIYDGIM